MGNFGVALIDEELRAQLVPGEVPLAHEQASMRGAADRSGKAGRPKLVEGFNGPSLGNILTGDTGFRAEDDYFDSKLSGIGVEGAVGAWGQQVGDAIGFLNILMLTNQRLAVVEMENRQVILSVPRQELVGVRKAPRLFQAGRLELAFRDGSIVRPTLAVLIPRASNRFLRAFETGEPQS